MGNYENLKQSITEVIRTNGNQEITGAVLQSTLLTIISTVGANATFAGVATPATNPGTPDGPVFYLASESGTYTNFDAIELQDGLSVLMWNGSWSSQQIFGVDNEPTAGSDNIVKSGGVFNNIGAIDISELNATENPHTLAKYEDLAAALNALPASYRKGGMSVKFVQSSDNKYVQYRLMSDSFNTTEANWQGVDEEPKKDSKNLITSGGVAEKFAKLDVYSKNIDGSNVALIPSIDGQVTNGRYVYFSSGGGGVPATADNADVEYVVIPILGTNVVRIKREYAINSASNNFFIFKGDDITVTSDFIEYWGYLSTNPTYLTFATVDENNITLDIPALLAVFPAATHIFFNLDNNSYEDNEAIEINANIKKALDWLDISNNDTILELKDEKIASYFQNEVIQTAESIDEKATSSSLVVNIVTDTHERYWVQDDVRVYDESFANIKAVNKLHSSDFLAHLGDLLSPQTISKYIDQNTVNEAIRNIWNRLRNAKPFSVMVIGNHDGINASVPTQYGAYPIMGMDCYCERPGCEPYFYVDKPSIKVRCIFLACPFVPADSQRYAWTFGEEQISWLVNTALNTADDWHCIFFSHTALYTDDMSQSEYADITGIINAYNNHTSFTTSGGIVADFTSMTSTKSVAWLCGHEHGDAVITDTSVLPRYSLVCPIIITAAHYRYGAGGSIGTVPSRTNKSVTQDLWDTMIYRRDLAKIYMVRFGAGNDREISV